MHLPGSSQEVSENTQSFHFLSFLISRVSPQTTIQTPNKSQNQEERAGCGFTY